MPRHTSIGIIGTGWVGSSVAISILQAGIANELILYDIVDEIAEGEAMDLAHGSSFYPSAAVRKGSIKQMMSADAVVIAAGKGGTSGQSRLELINDNLSIVRDLAHQMRGFKGIVIMVTNPVDVLTFIFTKVSGLSPQQVISTGTMLDTARLRQILGRELSLDPRSIHAQVIGEHGDSEVVMWSSACVGGIALRSWPGWRIDQEAGIEDEVRAAAREIIKRKGATNHAIGLVTATLLRWMLRGDRRVMTVARVQSGALGLHDVALSLPTIVSEEGAVEVLEPKLDEKETIALQHSASVIRKAIELAGQ